jgi:hypothetical protein
LEFLPLLPSPRASTERDESSCDAASANVESDKNYTTIYTTAAFIARVGDGRLGTLFTRFASEGSATAFVAFIASVGDA